MKELKQELKNGSFQKAYLFFGEERFLVREYERRLSQSVTAGEEMNLEVYDSTASVEAVMDAVETLPFMGGHRCVVIRESRLFASGRKSESEKAESEKMADALKDLPETTVLLFVARDVDKRSKLYKAVAKFGRAVEFKPLNEKELTGWMQKMARHHSREISLSTAVQLLRTAGSSMDALHREMQKLIDLKDAGEEITGQDVQDFVTPNVEVKIFDLVGAVGNGRLSQALETYQGLLLMKEPPMMILSMLARQFRLILLCRDSAEQGMSPGETAEKLNLRGFVVSECLRQSRLFTKERLLSALSACLDADLSVKQGRMSDRLAVELLILEYTAAPV